MSTIATVISNVRTLANEVNTSNPTDAMFLVWVNSMTGRMYRKIVGADPSLDLYSTAVSLAAGTGAYSLPASFLRAVGVFWQDTSGNKVQMHRGSIDSQPMSNDTSFYNRYGYIDARYEIVGSTIKVYPATYNEGSIVLYYNKDHTPHTSTASSLPSWFNSAAIDFVTYRVAALAVTKSESGPVQMFLSLAAEAEADAMREYVKRDINEPVSFVDMFNRGGRV